MLAEHTAHQISLIYYVIILFLFAIYMTREIFLSARIDALEKMLKEAQDIILKAQIAQKEAVHAVYAPVDPELDSNVVSLSEWKDGRSRRPLRKISSVGRDIA